MPNQFLYIRMLAAMILSLVVVQAMGQRIIVNSQGDRIVMYPDGSWRPVEPGDSVLVRQYLHRTDSPPDAAPANGKNKDRNKAEGLDYLARQWTEFYSALLAEDKQAQNDFRTATNAQFKAGQQLSNAESNSKLLDADHLANLKEAYEKSIQSLKKAKSRQQQIKAILSKANKVHQKIESLTESKINSLKTKFQIYASTFQTSPAPRTQPSTEPVVLPPATPDIILSSEKKAEPTPVKNERKPDAPASSGGSWPAHRVSKPYVSPTVECRYSSNAVDEATGRKKAELMPAAIFTHTDPDLRPYFKDKDLITCTGRLSKIGPYMYLTIQFEIASSHSQNNFGSLQSGSLLRFKLLDGDFVSLYNLKTDRGRIDPYSGHTIFTGQYALGKDEIKRLGRSELDKMRVLWGTGYEDYEVYHVDFLIRQLACLASNK